MIDKIEAIGEYVFVKKDESPIERLGLAIPESGRQKPNTGIILSVGDLVQDKRVKKGRKAIFNASAGFPIEIFDEVITVLNQTQVLGLVAQ